MDVAEHEQKHARETACDVLQWQARHQQDGERSEHEQRQPANPDFQTHRLSCPRREK